MEDFAKRLIAFREKMQLNPSEFAKKVGLGSSNIRAYEKGIKPSSDVIEKISNAFDELNLTWLITGKEEMLKEKDTGNGMMVNEPGGYYKATKNQNVDLISCYQKVKQLEGELYLSKKNIELQEKLIEGK